MVRQDKITYIITSFNGEGWFELPKQESVVDFLNSHIKYSTLSEANIQHLTQDEYIPDDELYKNLISLDNVDDDLAKLAMCYSFDRDILPVDDSINMVLSRIGVVSRYKTNDENFELLGKYIPVERSKFLHVNLIKIATKFCDEDSPQCESCFFSDYCDYSQHKNEWRI